MPFPKGQSGNPGGRTQEKLIADALRVAMLADSEEKDETGKRKSRLRAAAEKVAIKAAEGDLAAFNVAADRLDGKPTQAIAEDPDNPIGSTLLDVMRRIDGASRDLPGKFVPGETAPIVNGSGGQRVQEK